MQRFKALTWDHPRGYNALAAAAQLPTLAASGIAIDWDKQSLEGFESHPIADLCARYDLVVLDHPHVGEAVRAGCLQPLEDVFDYGTIARLEKDSIGPSFASYRFADAHWALPLDAATQVMACRQDLLDESVPATWDEVVHLSQRTGKVALSLAGPHALLSFLSIVASLGEPPAQSDPDLLVSQHTGTLAYALMTDLALRSPASVLDKNPIGILSQMAGGNDVILCPLIYGYVNYAAPGQGHTVAFHNAPRHGADGRPGSTLGGTGIGISRRCSVTSALKDHLLWLMSVEAQTQFIPGHEGQPSRRAAWHDAEINARWGSFYENTAETLETAYVRPRHDGYVAFQAKASAVLRHAFAEGASARDVIPALQKLYRQHRHAGSER
jgi:multiple sugar transport system substrate-binding protein